MQPDDVARYLQDNPKFFEDYAELLAHLYIPHPHGGRTISITERQILTLREKCRALEGKLGELIHFGEDNDAISAKVHRLSVALLAAHDFEQTAQALDFHLREDFAVPHVAVRLWGVPAQDRIEFREVSEQTRISAAGLAYPFCGPAGSHESVQWFGDDAPHVRSLAIVALRREAETIGMLALGSEDPERFYPDMGTIYLVRIGELAAAAFVRTLG
ncbi:MAG TPA: DUF484 family protein [Rhodocyclaceae bacterium]|nr:DUF484 family protein [Rhodocyclaceae bacterium]HMV53871.1 DUF484 family protein [Rhodocyclaceae bacterium]HMZ84560.1 DUF484 family protein [Rhodocyclaceae bacterium]HNA03914.1 DUF484 family protein [Rhodocyclaceae bacterium]HNB79175.1 DUF484 family protein [Rhodocyclaceae bacterium]